MISVFDNAGNYNLVEVPWKDVDKFAVCKIRPSVIDFTAYKPSPRTMLLDRVWVNAASADQYYHALTKCASPLGMQIPSVRLKGYLDAKRAFFDGLRASEEYLLPSMVARGEATLPALCRAFNPGAFALLALPAYLVADLDGFEGYSRAGHEVLRGKYRGSVPSVSGAPETVGSFAGFATALASHAFAIDNTGVFLMTYGLAASLSCFVNTFGDVFGAPSYQAVLSYQPLLNLIETLEAMGAIHNRFAGERFWPSYDLGIGNFAELDEGLRSTLELTRVLPPLPTPEWAGFTHARTLTVFFGLVDYFNLRGYLGIDPSLKFQFPPTAVPAEASAEVTAPEGEPSLVLVKGAGEEDQAEELEEEVEMTAEKDELVEMVEAEDEEPTEDEEPAEDDEDVEEDDEDDAEDALEGVCEELTGFLYEDGTLELGTPGLPANPDKAVARYFASYLAEQAQAVKLKKAGKKKWSDWRKSVVSAKVMGPCAPLSCKYLFFGLKKLENVDLSGLDTSHCLDMRGMFRGCKSLAALDLSNLEIPEDAKTKDMFKGCPTDQIISQ